MQQSQAVDLTAEDLADIFSFPRKKKVAWLTGAGVEPQLVLPDTVPQDWLGAASSWSAFVRMLGREVASRFGLNGLLETQLAQPNVQAADIVDDLLQRVASGLNIVVPPMTISHLAGSVLDRWQVRSAAWMWLAPCCKQITDKRRSICSICAICYVRHCSRIYF